LKEGLRRETADAIAGGRRPLDMAEDEEVAYEAATEILRAKRISDATYRRAVATFGEQGVIDLLGVVGYYNFSRDRDECHSDGVAGQRFRTAQALPRITPEPLGRPRCGAPAKGQHNLIAE
jgi:hypothetical protein